ncbi:hypothetical protein [Clostridium estertheticum]|uniref:hypothetical protein n=1 Tax=Clostridium estertheticum TaxID=238834 RepID=UPI001C6ECE31|nr:hypothetical protein [Clostridium estertheticum]MBW9153264.1 hypothetical protein [Clostridium estertheticum]WLC83115.1 hypothetical protein KTC97_13510 [Clostridium estertheticum]
MILSKSSVTNIRNGIEVVTFQSKLYYRYEIVKYFEYYLTKKYKQNYVTNVCLKNVNQYIDWYSLNNINNYFILSKDNYNKYGLYLQNSKGYKKSTILSKIVSLRKLNEFLIKFNQQNGNKDFPNHLKRNNNQYNYLTESYIRL